MAGRLTYHFDWDPLKARTNQAKHDVSFQEAATVFFDHFALNLYDAQHSDKEERWVTIGETHAGRLLLVVHTFTATSPTDAHLRLISARKPTQRERQQYEERR